MNDRDFRRMIRRAVLGISAAPLLLLPGCGDEAPFFKVDPNASVIPSLDGGFPDLDPQIRYLEAGIPYIAAGHLCVPAPRSLDAGIPVLDAGIPVLDGGIPAGMWTFLFPGWCASNGPVQTSAGPIEKDGSVRLDPCVCASLCPHSHGPLPITECTPASSSELICWESFCPAGRLAEGIDTRAEGSGLGRSFADMAAHEAAAVVAFEQLAVELGRHSLPEGLRRGALRAADEERRHTRLVGALSRRHGGRFGIDRTQSTEVRSLEAIALDNAVEGCARETFGAMIGLYQSRHAPDPSVRAVLASVAEDEIGHGSWSWALHQELSARLPLSARRKIRAARDGALQTLTEGWLAQHSVTERIELGLPDEERLHSMAATLRDSLYV